MSNYTTEVRYICEHYAGMTESKGYSDINDIIKKAIPKIFEKFEIFDEDYRTVLCTKILRHYYTREIGAETVALWKFWLNTRLNEIMPYYNKMYKSELLVFNPFYDVDINRTHQKENTGKETAKGTTATETDSTINTENNLTDKTEQSTNSTNTGTNYNLFSDTPQGGLDGVDSETYLTTASKDKINETTKGSQTNNRTGNSETNTDSSTSSSQNVSNNKDINSTEEYLEKVSGKQSSASYASLLMEYRNSFINIDMMIIEELSDLFFNLW